MVFDSFIGQTARSNAITVDHLLQLCDRSKPGQMGSCELEKKGKKKGLSTLLVEEPL